MLPSRMGMRGWVKTGGRENSLSKLTAWKQSREFKGYQLQLCAQVKDHGHMGHAGFKARGQLLLVE